MRGRGTLLGVALIILSMIRVSGWAQESLVPKGDEVLFGTWVNESSGADLLHGQKVVVTGDGMQVFIRLADQAPGMVVAWEIARKWIDSDGSTWYETFMTATAGAYNGAKWQALEKVSPSGKTWERAANLLEMGRFHPAFFPKTIDPKGAYYRILYRTEE